MGVTSNEFPLLNKAGLYVKATAGNGNCLFNALSDQMYGDQSKHGELRSGVIKHMRDNAAYYKQFITVHPGGGVRRNPKRKNAGTFSTPCNNTGPTAEEINQVFEGHLKEMARGGTYGDNMEISAFSQAFKVDVKIYQKDFAYVVSTKPAGTLGVPVVHIAYHVWEHYSSIRNLDGPHAGLPEIKERSDSSGNEKDTGKTHANTPVVQPWMVGLVTNSLPYIADQNVIQQTIAECGGNTDAAILKLLDAEPQSSASSARGSSSVERDVDSDDEEPVRGPKKRQDRRLSRQVPPTFALGKEERRSQDLSLRMKGDHVVKTIESSPPLEDNRFHGVRLEDADETEEEDWGNGSTYRDSESASVSTSASELSTASKPRSGGVRLKLSQPKKYQTSSSSQGDHQAIRGKATNGGGSKLSPRSIDRPKQRKLASRNTLEMVRKADWKPAKEQRKQIVATRRAVNGPNGTTPLMMKKDKENAFEAIKVLYI